MLHPALHGRGCRPHGKGRQSSRQIQLSLTRPFDAASFAATGCPKCKAPKLCQCRTSGSTGPPLCLRHETWKPFVELSLRAQHSQSARRVDSERCQAVQEIQNESQSWYAKASAVVEEPRDLIKLGFTLLMQKIRPEFKSSRELFCLLQQLAKLCG